MCDSQLSGYRLDRTQEGWTILIRLRHVGLLVVEANVAWIRDAHALDCATLGDPYDFDGLASPELPHPLLGFGGCSIPSDAT